MVWTGSHGQSLETPLAISLALVTESAESTTLMAANVGGDVDTVASIAGAIAGALRPKTVKQEWFEIVSAVNPDDIITAALSAVALRQ